MQLRLEGMVSEIVATHKAATARSAVADVIDLDPMHLIAVRAIRPELSEEQAAQYICNSIITLPEVKFPGQPVHLPGCILDNPPVYEWRKGVPIVYITPPATREDLSIQSHLSDDVGLWLRNEIAGSGLNLKDIFLTASIRFPLGEGMTSYREAHKKSNAALFRADILGLNPRLIIASGSEALKGLFGRNAKMDNYEGQFHDWHGTTVLVVPSHNQFAYGHASLDVFRSYLERARDFLIFNGVSQVQVDRSKYRVCTSPWEIEATCKEVIAKVESGEVEVVVFDTEFGNDVAREEEVYTLSVQIAWNRGEAAYFGFYGCQGHAFMTDAEIAKAVDSMRALFEHPKVRLAGHHLRVDIQRLSEMEINVDDKLETGYDTMLMHHLLFGDDDQGLEVLTRKFAPQFGNYWKPLEDWLTENGRESNLDFGYRNIPDEILIPYSMDDVAVTWEALHCLLDLFAKPENAHLFEIYKNITAPTSLHLLDVERQGILVDEVQRTELRGIYQPVYDAILAKLRELLNWPSFNPGSKDQVLMLLFSDCVFRDKKPHVVPPGARVLHGMTPISNTDKYPRDWEEIMLAGVADRHTPSTKSESLDLLALKYPCDEIKYLQQVLILGKFLRDYLHAVELNEFGVPCDGKGIHNNIYRDGRVRTHLWQTSETHRYRSSKPNLQTSPKRQESEAFAVFVDYFFGCDVKEYKRRTDDDKKPTDGSWIPPDKRLNIPSYKSCLIAPEGYVLIEADFQTAELAQLAYASGDPVLTAIVQQGRDLHSEMACVAFKLPLLAEMEAAITVLDGGVVTKGCPYDKWCDKFKKSYKDFRDASKTVNFGILYGRGARALTREIGKAGVSITQDETQGLINGFAKRFSVAWAWMQANMDSAIENGWVEDCARRRRYFTGVRQLSKSQQAAARRQASNSPIQGSVAFLLSLAGINLYRFRYRTDIGKALGFSIILPIHDAFLFQVPIPSVPQMVKVIKFCMGTACKIPGTDKNLGVDIEIFTRWGVKLPKAEVVSLLGAA
jgi:DNA polymerase-1